MGYRRLDLAKARLNVDRGNTYVDFLYYYCSLLAVYKALHGSYNAYYSVTSIALSSQCSSDLQHEG
jgi:hypothetical protein